MCISRLVSIFMITTVVIRLSASCMEYHRLISELIFAKKLTFYDSFIVHCHVYYIMKEINKTVVSLPKPVFCLISTYMFYNYLVQPVHNG